MQDKLLKVTTMWEFGAKIFREDNRARLSLVLIFCMTLNSNSLYHGNLKFLASNNAESLVYANSIARPHSLLLIVCDNPIRTIV